MKKINRAQVFNYHEIKEPRGQKTEHKDEDISMCWKCEYYDGEGTCDLFKMHNKKMPEIYELDIRVTKNGVCDAYTKAIGSLKRMRRLQKIKAQEENSENKRGVIFED